MASLPVVAPVPPVLAPVPMLDDLAPYSEVASARSRAATGCCRHLAANSNGLIRMENAPQ